MAIEAERLLAIFEAKFTSLEKALAKARTDANKSFGDIQAAGARAETALSKVGSKGTPGFDRMAKSVRGSRLETANLAAQLNDIGAQLAGGQSPFLIAIQQGTQINQVLGQAGARGAVSLLGGAFLSLVNPVSLATIGIITLGGAAVQYFTQLLSQSDDSAEALKSQANLIQKVADKWGEALPALKAYADEQKRLAEEAERNEATQIVVGATYSKIKSDLEQIRQSARDAGNEVLTFGASLEEARNVEPAVDAALQAIDALEQKTRDGTETTEDFDRVLNAVAEVLENNVVDAISGATHKLDTFTSRIKTAKGALEQLKFNRAVENGNLQLPQLDPLGFIDPMRDQTNRANATKSQTQTERERNALRSAGGGSSGVSEAERERQAVADLVEQLQFEYDLIGKSDVEREKAYALRRAGAAATDEQKSKIASLVESIHAEGEALRENERAMRDLQEIGRDFLGGFIHDLTQGKSAADSLADALGRVGDRLLDMALDGLFSGNGFGTGKGGLLGGILIPGILHSGGVAGRDGYGHGRAVSPSVFAGARRYHQGGVAGLQPGEVPAILQRGEVVLPKNVSRSAATPAITYAPVYNVAQGADPAAIAELKKAQAKDRAEFQSKVVKAIAGARVHGAKI